MHNQGNHSLGKSHADNRSMLSQSKCWLFRALRTEHHHSAATSSIKAQCRTMQSSLLKLLVKTSQTLPAVLCVADNAILVNSKFYGCTNLSWKCCHYDGTLQSWLLRDCIRSCPSDDPSSSALHLVTIWCSWSHGTLGVLVPWLTT